MRKLRDRFQLLFRVNGAHLRRLRDRDDARLHVMFVAKHVQQRFELFESQLAVGCRHVDQFATREVFRRAAFVDVDVCRFRANDSLIRFGDRFQSECVCASAAEDEINLDVFAEMFLKCLTARAVMSSSPYAIT